VNDLWLVTGLITVVRFPEGTKKGLFLFSTASRPALLPTQPSIKWVSGSLSPGLKRPGHEADHTRPSSAEFNVWTIPPLSHMF
jgi:hypothetical protein